MFAWPRALTLTLLRELRVFRSSSAGLFSTNSAKHSFRNWEDALSVAVPSTSIWKPCVSSVQSLISSLKASISSAPHPVFTARLLNCPFPSVGATEQTLLTAVRNDGITTLKGAAIEPEIMDLINVLQKMGAIILSIPTAPSVSRVWNP